MRDTVLRRKQARIIMALVAEMAISDERASNLSCTTETFWEFTDRKYGLQLMSDGYIVEDVLSELR